MSSFLAPEKRDERNVRNIEVRDPALDSAKQEEFRTSRPVRYPEGSSEDKDDTRFRSHTKYDRMEDERRAGTGARAHVEDGSRRSHNSASLCKRHSQDSLTQNGAPPSPPKKASSSMGLGAGSRHNMEPGDKRNMSNPQGDKIRPEPSGTKMEQENKFYGQSAALRGSGVRLGEERNGGHGGAQNAPRAVSWLDDQKTASYGSSAYRPAEGSSRDEGDREQPAAQRAPCASGERREEVRANAHRRPVNRSISEDEMAKKMRNFRAQQMDVLHEASAAATWKREKKKCPPRVKDPWEAKGIINTKGEVFGIFKSKRKSYNQPRFTTDDETIDVWVNGICYKVRIAPAFSDFAEHRKESQGFQFPRGMVFLHRQTGTTVEYLESRRTGFPVKQYEMYRDQYETECEPGVYEYVIAGWEPREEKYLCYEAGEVDALVYMSQKTILEEAFTEEGVEREFPASSDDGALTFEDQYPEQPQVDTKFKKLGFKNTAEQKEVAAIGNLVQMSKYRPIDTSLSLS